MHTTDIFYFILILYGSVSSFNIDTNNILVYVDPAKADNSSKLTSYFGYTVVLFRNRIKNQSWIMIGAPRGQDPGISQFHNTGVVYRCPFMGTCETIPIYEGSPFPKGNLTDAWIGGTMDINYKYEVLSICGFRRNIRRYYLGGACYLSKLNFIEHFEEFLPLPDIPLLMQQRERNIFLYGEGQAGFSAHFATEEPHLILGAPGVYNWAGTTVDVEYAICNNPVANRFRGKRGTCRNINIADASTQVNQLDLFGYAITSGYFYGKKQLYYAASTPKYSKEKENSYRGWVVIFKFHGNNRPLHIKETRLGNEFEYFGATITAGDINGDGYDDLLVGAPYFSGKTYNEGSVHVFLSLGKEKKLETDSKKLYGGNAKAGQFGSAIMFLKDINNDGYGDVAVGAPYEDDQGGVLYIYSGTSRGLDSTYSQRIVGKDISSEIRGFGISISRPFDIDENGFDDIAVGAHLSGNAVLLRTRPIVVINYVMRAYPEIIKREAKKFFLEICFGYTIFNETILEIERTLAVDGSLRRATINNKNQEVKNISISPQDTCENITLYLKKTTNYKAPITVFLSYKLVHQSQPQKKAILITDTEIRGNDNFCLRCPVLDEHRSSPSSTINIPFALDSLGCGDDNVCQAELSIEVKIKNLKKENTFIVGSMKYVDLEVVVKNTGEKAYLTKLEIKLPNNVFLEETSSCVGTHPLFICPIDNPLVENAKKTIQLNLDMSDINEDNNENGLDVLLRVNTTSDNNNTDWTTLTLKLDRIADIKVSGISDQQSHPFGNATHGMPNFTHIYQVDKLGVSPLGKVVVNISIPYALRSKNGDTTFIQLYEPEGKFYTQPVKCISDFVYISDVIGATKTLTTDDNRRRKRQVEVFQEGKSKRSEDIEIAGKEYGIASKDMMFIKCGMEEVICSNVMCTLGPFKGPMTTAVITIKMMFDTEAISDLLERKNFILYTTSGSVTIENPFGLIQNEDGSYSRDVSSIFVNEVPYAAKVALWIIIVSLIIGLLLLVLMVYGLFKIGFFNRAKKEELDNLIAAIQQEQNQEQENEHPDSDDDITEDPFESLPQGSQEAIIEETK